MEDRPKLTLLPLAAMKSQTGTLVGGTCHLLGVTLAVLRPYGRLRVHECVASVEGYRKLRESRFICYDLSREGSFPRCSRDVSQRRYLPG